MGRAQIKLLVITLLCLPFSSQANPISITELLDKVEKTGDTTYLVSVFQRCAAVYGVLLEDLPELEPLFAKLYERGSRINHHKLQSHNPDLEPKETVDRYDKGLYQYAEMYRKRMNENMINTGDQITSDPWIMAEMESCKAVASLQDESE